MRLSWLRDTMLADGDLMVCKKLLYFQYLMDQINLKDEKSHFSFDLVLELHNKYFDLILKQQQQRLIVWFFSRQDEPKENLFLSKISISRQDEPKENLFLSKISISRPNLVIRSNLSTTIATYVSMSKAEEFEVKYHSRNEEMCCQYC